MCRGLFISGQIALTVGTRHTGGLMIRTYFVRGFLVLVIGVVLVLAVFRVAAAFRETRDVADILPDHGRLVATKSEDVFIQEIGPVDGPPVLLLRGTAAWSQL